MVEVFGWQEEFSVGIKEIDDQHRGLIKILDDLNRSLLKAQCDEEMVESMFTRLCDYAEKHFAAEERLFKRYRYPEEKEHVAEHHAFLAKMKKFQKSHDRGNRGVCIELHKFVKEWFVDHLQTTDYRYVPFFRDQGVAAPAERRPDLP